MNAERTFETVANGAALRGHLAGEGEPVLCLHGGPGLSCYLGELTAELRSAGCRTLRYTQRGVPPSSDEGPFDLATHVADALAVLDDHGAERAIVVGHSWGGYLGLQLAARHPERVCGLLAIGALGGVGDGGMAALGPTLMGRVDDATRARVEELEAREEAGTATEAESLEGLRLLWPAYFHDASAAPPLPEGLRFSLAAHLGAMAGIEADVAAGTLAEALARCSVATVFLHGTADPLPIDAAAYATAAVMPDAEVVTVAACGHFPWLEQPGSAVAALRLLRSGIAAPA